MKIRKDHFLLSIFFISIFVTSCSSTKFYSERDVDVISQLEELEELPEEIQENIDSSSIHYIETNRTIKSTCSTDGKLFAFYTFGLPFVVLGCTVRECVKVVGYSAINSVFGFFAYFNHTHNKSDNLFGFFLPNTKKDKADYLAMKNEYKNSDLYKYKKYRKPLTKAEITDSIIVEEVDWNDERKLLSSSTKTLSVKTSVADSAKRISKRASIVGNMVGSVTSVIVGVPSWFVGFIFAAVYDTADN